MPTWHSTSKGDWLPTSRQHPPLLPLKGSLAPSPQPFLVPPGKEQDGFSVSSYIVKTTTLQPWQDGDPTPLPTCLSQGAERNDCEYGS